MPSITCDIRGIQEAQARNLRRIAAIRPGGAFEAEIQTLAIETHRVAVVYTHVDSGSLRGSQRIELQGRRARIYLDPGAVNPRTNRRPAEYGVYENARGGSHAFYDLTLQDMRSRLPRTYRNITMAITNV